jgi:hypothetical protein
VIVFGSVLIFSGLFLLIWGYYFAKLQFDAIFGHVLQSLKPLIYKDLRSFAVPVRSVFVPDLPAKIRATPWGFWAGQGGGGLTSPAEKNQKRPYHKMTPKIPQFISQ